MFDKEAIQELTKAQAITAAHNSTLSAITGGPGVITLPANFETRDLEKYLKNRRRLRGNMTTSVVKDFASYAEKNAESGAAIFIEPDKMTATAVLNLGTTTEPGHADNLAKLEMKRTAAYEALRRIANEQDKYLVTTLLNSIEGDLDNDISTTALRSHERNASTGFACRDRESFS
jgi:uncharacterized protein YfdQ (DUF2303 family)